MQRKNRLFLVLLVTFVMLGAFAVDRAEAQTGVFFITGGNAGVNNAAPAFKLDVNGNLRAANLAGGTAALIFEITNGANNRRWQFQLPAGSGNFEIRDQTGAATPFTIEKGAPAQLMRLTAAGQVKVKGAVVHADYVFEPDFKLESIEEHASFMFANKHLPAVGPGLYDEDGQPYFDLANSRQGMLEELEKAHVYISQLNEQLQTTKLQNLELSERLDRLESRLTSTSD